MEENGIEWHRGLTEEKVMILIILFMYYMYSYILFWMVKWNMQVSFSFLHAKFLRQVEKIIVSFPCPLHESCIIKVLFPRQLMRFMHFSLTDGNIYRLHADKFHKPGHDQIMKLFTFFFFFWPTILGTSGSTFLFFFKKKK